MMHLKDMSCWELSLYIKENPKLKTVLILFTRFGIRSGHDVGGEDWVYNLGNSWREGGSIYWKGNDWKDILITVFCVCSSMIYFPTFQLFILSNFY